MKRIVIDWLEMTANSQDIKIQILKRDMDPFGGRRNSSTAMEKRLAVLDDKTTLNEKQK
jgi:hypothetical protein